MVIARKAKNHTQQQNQSSKFCYSLLKIHRHQN